MVLRLVKWLPKQRDVLQIHPAVGGNHMGGLNLKCQFKEDFKPAF